MHLETDSTIKNKRKLKLLWELLMNNVHYSSDILPKTSEYGS
jgi:hypothetical protein